MTVFANIVANNFVESHTCPCPRGCSSLRIASSWKVRIPLSLFFQKYSTLFLVSAFHAFEIISTVGYDNGVKVWDKSP